jgi:hypothetical protein
VLEKSNAERDNLWDLVNGGSTDLEATGDGKPEAWKRGLVLDGDEVRVNDGSSLDEVDTLPEYKQRLVDDFDFMGAKTDFLRAGGEATFVGAVLRRYPTHPLGEENLKALAERIWSYAMTGADSDGHTDIGELQGLLYQLDGRIQTSSDTNTPMSTETLKVGDEDVPMGDDVHGRATTLTTRHLMYELLERDADLTVVLMDVSPSMADERKHLADILKVAPPKGDVSIATFGHHTDDTKFKWDKDVQGDHADEWASMQDQLASLQIEVDRTKKATRTAADARDGTEPKKLAYEEARDAWFALRDRLADLNTDAKAFWEEHRSLDRMTPSQAQTSLMNPDNDPLYKKPDPMQPLESGFKAAWDALDHLPPPKTDNESRLMVIYTDEGDIEGLRLNPLKAKAARLGVSITVCYSMQLNDQSTSYVVFDLNEVQTSDIRRGGLSWKFLQERLQKTEQSW